jgi:hypothetical protein
MARLDMGEMLKTELASEQRRPRDRDNCIGISFMSAIRQSWIHVAQWPDEIEKKRMIGWESLDCCKLTLRGRQGIDPIRITGNRLMIPGEIDRSMQMDETARTQFQTGLMAPMKQ